MAFEDVNVVPLPFWAFDVALDDAASLMPWRYVTKSDIVSTPVAMISNTCSGRAKIVPGGANNGS